MTMDLHHADTMLNPYVLDDLRIHEGAIVKSRSLDVMRLTTCIDGQYGWVVAKCQPFKAHRGASVNMHLAVEPSFHLGGSLAKIVETTCNKKKIGSCKKKIVHKI